MPFTLSISGSTILSASDRLAELFTHGSSAIEVGLFAGEADYAYLRHACRQRNLPIGIHSPLYREGNRIGLLCGDESLWDELEQELATGRRDGWAYLLVHLQYRQREPVDTAMAAIRSAALRAAALSRRYGVPLVLEPKLGEGRDHSLLLQLHQLPMAELASWGLPWCLDVGDIYLACQQSGLPYEQLVSHLAPLVQVVHLHDVVIAGEQYFWTPVTGQDAVPIAETLALLRPFDREVFAVLEHTPHRVASGQQVREGIAWLRQQFRSPADE